MSELINVFIGYDPKEAVAFSVLSHSIHANATRPVSITPLSLTQLRDEMTRERHPLQSTDFSFSRFLVPYLSGYQGWSIFMDNDMLFQEDIADLWAMKDENYAVQVVKHIHIPSEEKKFLHQPQTKYEKKNWSSVILFNNSRCRALTKEYVNTASGLDLHQFKWLDSDDEIGELPAKWNYLVGCGQKVNKPANIHFTLGGPYFHETIDCEFSKEWFEMREAMLFCEQSK